MTKPPSDSKRIDVGATELRAKLAHYLTCAGFYGKQVIVSKPGLPEPFAVVISYKEFQRLSQRFAKVA
jgi:prevent-host-death family protein